MWEARWHLGGPPELSMLMDMKTDLGRRENNLIWSYHYSLFPSWKKNFFCFSCLFSFPLHNTFKLSSEIGIAEFLSDNHECVLLLGFFSVLV